MLYILVFQGASKLPVVTAFASPELSIYYIDCLTLMQQNFDSWLELQGCKDSKFNRLALRGKWPIFSKLAQGPNVLLHTQPKF